MIQSECCFKCLLLLRPTVVFGLEKPNILILSYDYKRDFKDIIC